MLLKKHIEICGPQGLLQLWWWCALRYVHCTPGGFNVEGENRREPPIDLKVQPGFPVGNLLPTPSKLGDLAHPIVCKKGPWRTPLRVSNHKPSLIICWMVTSHEIPIFFNRKSHVGWWNPIINHVFPCFSIIFPSQSHDLMLSPWFFSIAISIRIARRAGLREPRHRRDHGPHGEVRDASGELRADAGGRGDRVIWHRMTNGVKGQFTPQKSSWWQWFQWSSNYAPGLSRHVCTSESLSG